MSATLIATLPPYARHREALAAHPAVAALRFNTVMPIGEPRRDVLAALVSICKGKPLLIDLKARQLRVTRFAYLPYAFVEISRRISVELPARVRFKDCEADLVRVVDGCKLILADRPARVVGAGEPITIVAPSLVIEGYLTDGDRAYVEAARALGLHDYLLSFAEQPGDLDELRALDPEARITAKIESARGLDLVRAGVAGAAGVRLMAARDDLYLQLGGDGPATLEALEAIIRADPHAVVASRLLSSLEDQGEPALADVSDLVLMHDLGYRTFMLGDAVCFGERSWQAAVELFARVMAWRRARG